MSDWAEDDMPDTPAIQGAKPELRAETFGVDVLSLAGEQVDQAVKAAVRKQVAAVAAEAAEVAFSDEVLDDLRRRARAAADATVERLQETEAEASAQEQQLATSDVTAEERPRLYYGSVSEFVSQYLIYVYRRRVGIAARRWSGRWWANEEAVSRLEALWRSWESLRLDPATGISVWFRDHADHHMAVLMDPDGPFAAVDFDDDENGNGKGEALPHVDPPDGMFPDVRESRSH